MGRPSQRGFREGRPPVPGRGPVIFHPPCPGFIALVVLAALAQADALRCQRGCCRQAGLLGSVAGVQRGGSLRQRLIVHARSARARMLAGPDGLLRRAPETCWNHGAAASPVGCMHGGRRCTARRPERRQCMELHPQR